jgi:hypothetical protein
MAVKEQLKHEKSIMQCILNVCASYNIEPDRCKKYLDDNLKSKLEAEALELKLIRKTSTSETL